MSTSPQENPQFLNKKDYIRALIRTNISMEEFLEGFEEHSSPLFLSRDELFVMWLSEGIDDVISKMNEEFDLDEESKEESEPE